MRKCISLLPAGTAQKRSSLGVTQMRTKQCICMGPRFCEALRGTAGSNGYAENQLLKKEMVSIRTQTEIPVNKTVGAQQPELLSGIPDEAALEKINRYTRRKFRAEELYTFPVALCDNEVDRDGERFTVQALHGLAKLFVGKTGVFDHDPMAKNQTARIYDCHVEEDKSRLTSCGEPYTRLVADAYLPRTEANREFISALEAGIKKEVSVGCAVRSVKCSVCGADLRNGTCEHRRGQIYGGVLCCAVLDDPSDAYEWSFVAVPAQREAGVLKRFGVPNGRDVLKFLRETGGETILTPAQREALVAEFDRLEQQAADGREYRAELEKDFLRYGALAQPGLPWESLKTASKALSVQDLKNWNAAFRRQAEKTVPLSPQLAGDGKAKSEDGNEPFRI